MKYLLSMIALVLLSTVSFSQALQFRAYNAASREVKSGEITSMDVNFNIVITDYQMICNKDVYNFTTLPTVVSEVQFFCYATNPNGIKCRIWVKGESVNHFRIGVEYSDIIVMWDVVPL